MKELNLGMAEDISWEDSELMTPAERETMTPAERFRHDYSMAAISRMQERETPTTKLPLLKKAKTALGTPYVSGGTSLSGFDCSGFVQWAYRSVGVKLPRTAREQSYVGKAIDVDEMTAGDIVAFKHPRRGYHTGIYVGKGKFIHSPRRNKSVEINSLNDPYFSSTFLGARRIQVSAADAAEAEHLLAAYESGKLRNQRIRTDASLSKSSVSRSASKNVASKNMASKNKKAPVATAAAENKGGKNAKNDNKDTVGKSKASTAAPDKQTNNKRDAKSTVQQKQAPVAKASTKDAQKNATQARAKNEKAVPEKRVADKKASEKKTDVKAADQKRTDTKPADKKAPAAKSTDKKTSEKKAPEKKAPEKKAADKK